MNADRDLHRLCARLVQCCYTTRGANWHLDRAKRWAAVKELGHRVLGETQIGTHGVQLCLISAAGHRILVIPGSNQPLDWRRNLCCLPPVSDDGHLWHRGFDRASREVFGAKCLDTAATVMIDEATVITGHSFGAAVSQRLAARLWAEKRRRLIHVNFASPRVLWRKGRYDHNDHVTNYCRTDDLVCSLPGSYMIGPWHHLGHVVWLSPLTPHPGEDHGMPNYLDFLP